MQRDVIQQVLKSLSRKIHNAVVVQVDLDPGLVREFRELAAMAQQPGDYDKLRKDHDALRRDFEAFMTEWRGMRK